MGTIVVAALGDSIHAGSPYWDPDPDVRASYGDSLDEQSQWEYWAARKDPRLRFRNCGVCGERTDQIAVRFDACAEGADVLIVQGGINDIAQGRTSSRAAANLRAMVRAGRNAGSGSRSRTSCPGTRLAATPRADQRASTQLIDELARDEGVPVLPFHATLASPDAPGRMRDDVDFRRRSSVGRGLPASR